MSGAAFLNPRPKTADWIGNSEIAWRPMAGSQVAFLSSDAIFEVLYHGTRGPGKSSALIAAFLKHVGAGFGAAWRGVIFRRHHPDLADIKAKSKALIPRVFPDAKYNENDSEWRFPDGAVLMFKAFDRESDYDKFHGAELPFIGWEELTNWPSAVGYLKMMSVCRSSAPGIPKMVRATTNPSGPGHSWVKKRFRLGGRNTLIKVIRDSYDQDGTLERPRAAVFGHLGENKVLLAADPNYIQTIKQSAKNPAELAAWLHGSWDIVSGGAFDDIWDETHHVVKPFTVPLTWAIDRSFDWGSSKPYAAIWTAESDGSDIVYPDGTVFRTVKGDLFIIDELYGWDGEDLNTGCRRLASEVAADMRNVEYKRGIEKRVKAGPADTAIFTVENGHSIAADMSKAVMLEDGRMVPGVTFLTADKRPGSRKMAFQRVREYLSAATDRKRERPGLFFFDHCTFCLQTIPVLPRDKRDPDDIDTNAADHLIDCIKYRCNKPNYKIKKSRLVGLV